MLQAMRMTQGIIAFSALAVLATPVFGQSRPPRGAVQAPDPAPPPRYAEIAALVLRSPIIIDSVVRSQVVLRGAQAAGTPAGLVRLYIEADVRALVKGNESAPSRLSWLLDVAPDARGRVPKFAKQRVIAFARPIAGRSDQVQLTGADAQRVWTPAADALTRRIIAEVLAPDAPPAITGIANAFHVAGTLPGAGETQIFMQTESGRPVSISVLRRPGEAPQWAVALSEIVDEAAAPPLPDTLLWYRLACGLPRTLPATAVQAMESADRDQARADYRFVLTALGPCGG